MAMRLIVSAGAALFLLTCASAPAFSANGYQFTTIEPFGAVVTVPTGINSSGQVAGYFSKSYFNCCDDYAYTWQGFWFSNGNYIEFGVPGARWTKPLSINDSGQIFGVFFAGNGPEQAFAYDIISAQFTTLPINLAAVSSLFATITAISPSGSIVAGSFTGQKGFIFSNGQLLFPTPPLSSGASFFMNPVGVNSAGEIVGTYNVDGGGYAAAPFIYSNGDFTPFSDTGLLRRQSALPLRFWALFLQPTD